MDANTFKLRGKHLEIQYSSTSIAGVPLFAVHQGKEQRNFRGDQIRALPSEIGTLITVTLEVVPDLKSETLTVILPHVNVESGVEAEIGAPAIFTTAHTSIAGPALVKGAIESYRVDELKGTASFVIS